MTYLLDANTCIKFLNGQSDSVRRRFESLSASDLTLRVRRVRRKVTDRIYPPVVLYSE